MADDVASGSINELKKIFDSIKDIEKKPSPKKAINSFEHLKDIAPPFSQAVSLYIIIKDEKVPRWIKGIMIFLYIIGLIVFVLVIFSALKGPLMKPALTTFEVKNIECYQCIVLPEDNRYLSIASASTLPAKWHAPTIVKDSDRKSSSSIKPSVAPSKQLTTDRPGPI